MRFLVLLSLLIISPTVWANDELETYGNIQALHISKTVENIDLALLDASDYLERNPETEQLVLHNSLSQYVERTPGLRALIVIEKNGQLVLDSFTYPAKDINLKDREYVKSALNAKGRALFIGSPVVGRTSGAGFIPFSRPLLDTDKNTKAIIAGIIHPGFLIKQDTVCAQCLVGLIKNHEALVTYPSKATYPQAFIDRVSQATENEEFEFKLDSHTLNNLVIPIGKYGLKVVVSQIVTDY